MTDNHGRVHLAMRNMRRCAKQISYSVFVEMLSQLAAFLVPNGWWNVLAQSACATCVAYSVHRGGAFLGHYFEWKGQIRMEMMRYDARRYGVGTLTTPEPVSRETLNSTPPTPKE